MQPTAVSADGRRVVFEAPLGTSLPPGGFAVISTEPPLLAQVTAAEIAVHQVDGRRTAALEGEATVLGKASGGFSVRPIAPAPAEAIAAWADERLPADGLDLGVLVHAAGARARLDARGLARHTFLCGQSGSGKTYTTGVLLEQIVRRTSLRLIVIDPNSDHIGLRETRDDTDVELAEAHRRAVAGIHVARADADLPFTTMPIGMRFSNFDSTAQALALRLDPIGDGDELEALLDITEVLQAPYSPGDVAEAAKAVGTAAAHRLAIRIRALGIDGWEVWQRDPTIPVMGEVLETSRGLVVDTGSIGPPAERSAIAASVLATVWGRRAERVATLLVLDEAHHICPAQPADPIQAISTELAVQIAGEGRKYGIFLLVATQRPQKVHPSVVAGCESLVLMRMNSLRDVAELEESFSHVPAGLLRLAPGFVQGEALVAGALVPAPLHVRVGGRITPEGGGNVPSTWARVPTD